MNLVIVESPAKISKIKSFLGADFIVMASYGHVRDLPKNSFGIDEEYNPSYVPTDSGAKTLQNIALQASKAKLVYLATDPDREGEAIAWHIADELKLKHYKRIAFNEITETAVKKAVSNARDIDFDLVKAQEARRILDRLVGFKVSSPLSEALNQLGLSAGRVQSPALRIIVEREQLIRNFKSTTHFGVEALFVGWSAKWQSKNFLETGQEYILDKSLAERIAELKRFVITKFEKKEARLSPPPPFTTSTLQQASSNKYKWSLDKTMATAQKLFEAGHITYMRTDSVALSNEAIKEIRAYASKNEIEISLAPRTWKNKDNAQAGHEAIRPTHIEVELAGDNPAEQELYILIRNRTLATQLAEAVYADRKMNLEAEDKVQGKTVYFSASGRALVKSGWQKITQDDSNADEADTEASNPIPDLVERMVIEVRETRFLEQKTSPPKRYVEAALVRELERSGIGRPSTFASTVKHLMDKEYFKLDKRNLVPTSIGEKIVNTLKTRFSFLDYKFTAEMETKLDLIAEAKTTYLEVIKMADEKLNKELDGFGSNQKCDVCGEKVKRIKGEDKATKRAYDYYKCLNDECKTFYFTNTDGSRGNKKEKAEMFICTECKQAKVIRNKGNAKATGEPYDFYSCLGCASAFFTNEDGSMGKLKKKLVPCPDCKKGKVQRWEGVSAKGNPYDFYSCNNKECGATFETAEDGSMGEQQKKKN